MAALHTNETVFASVGIVPENLEFPDLEIPLLTGLQRQGDLMIVPTNSALGAGVSFGTGVDVVGPDDAVRNAHILIGEGTWHPVVGDGLVVGRVVVPDGCEAFLIHTEEHNAVGIGPGVYEIRQQREWDAAAASQAWEANRQGRDQAEMRQWLEQRAAYRRIRD